MTKASTLQQCIAANHAPTADVSHEHFVWNWGRGERTRMCASEYLLAS